MKKLISIFAALTMVATMFTSIASAEADVTFTAAGAKATYDISGTNKNVMVKVTITAPEGFAGFKNMIEYDTDAFTYVTATKSSDLGGLLQPAEKDGVVTVVYANGEDHMPTKWEWSDEEGDDVEKPCTYYYQIRFTAKEGIVNGNYEFKLTNDAPNLRNAAKEQLTGEIASNAVVTIKGGKDPAPAEPADATAEIVGYKPAVRTGFETCGVVGTANTADSQYVQIKFTGAKKLLAIDLGTVIDNVPVTFGLNIMSVPAGTKLAIEDVKALSEAPADAVVVDAE